MVWMENSVVLNPSYRSMGLYGSEYHTFSYRGRMGGEVSKKVCVGCKPMGAREAEQLGLVDLVLSAGEEMWIRIRTLISEGGGRTGCAPWVTRDRTRLASLEDMVLAARELDPKDREEELELFVEEEMRQMRLCFFATGERSERYHDRRRRFVRKIEAQRTPFRLAKHRRRAGWEEDWKVGFVLPFYSFAYFLLLGMQERKDEEEDEHWFNDPPEEITRTLSDTDLPEADSNRYLNENAMPHLSFEHETNHVDLGATAERELEKTPGFQEGEIGSVEDTMEQEKISSSQHSGTQVNGKELRLDEEEENNLQFTVSHPEHECSHCEPKAATESAPEENATTPIEELPDSPLLRRRPPEVSEDIVALKQTLLESAVVTQTPSIGRMDVTLPSKPLRPRTPKSPTERIPAPALIPLPPSATHLDSQPSFLDLAGTPTNDRITLHQGDSFPVPPPPNPTPVKCQNGETSELTSNGPQNPDMVAMIANAKPLDPAGVLEERHERRGNNLSASGHSQRPTASSGVSIHSPDSISPPSISIPTSRPSARDRSPSRVYILQNHNSRKRTVSTSEATTTSTPSHSRKRSGFRTMIRNLFHKNSGKSSVNSVADAVPLVPPLPHSKTFDQASVTVLRSPPLLSMEELAKLQPSSLARRRSLDARPSSSRLDGASSDARTQNRRTVVIVHDDPECPLGDVDINELKGGDSTIWRCYNSAQENGRYVD
ncbi:hypothetical protein BT69DRAFT_203234 [Atractiella rhizophila]|nr:hypothetical protein BT69DRAFT_203234 [Atractiella rhizophila]